MGRPAPLEDAHGSGLGHVARRFTAQECEMRPSQNATMIKSKAEVLASSETTTDTARTKMLCLEKWTERIASMGLGLLNYWFVWYQKFFAIKSKERLRSNTT